MAENEGSLDYSDGIGSILANISPAAAAEEAFLDKALEILSYAKDNAPWSDRTGQAREGLDVEVTRTDNEVTLTLFHTVTYGVWLETIRDGEFAIIMPTLELYAQEVFEAAGGKVQGQSERGDY